MEVNRNRYVDVLSACREDQKITLVEGLRECGKSYLLFTLFRNRLLTSGVRIDRITSIRLADDRFAAFRNFERLRDHIQSKVGANSDTHFVFIEEVSLVPEYLSLLSYLADLESVDMYITTSVRLAIPEGTALSEKVETVRVYPFSYGEMRSVLGATDGFMWNAYLRFGGLPIQFTREKPEVKSETLREQIDATYLPEARLTGLIRSPRTFDAVLSALCSSVGTLVSPASLSASLPPERSATPVTVANHLSAMESIFFIERVPRYDIGKHRESVTPCSYYFADTGILSTLAGQSGAVSLNAIYIELRSRRYRVRTGFVESRISRGGIQRYIQSTVDFVVEKGDRRYYLQYVPDTSDSERMAEAVYPFSRIKDSFGRVIVTSDGTPTRRTPDGILILSTADLMAADDPLGL